MASVIHIGKITRVAGAKVYVTVNALGEDEDEFGPLNVLLPVLLTPTVTSSGTAVSDSGTTGSANGPDPHTHSFSFTTATHTHTTNVGDAVADYFQKGDRVVVAQIGHVKENLIVLGKLA